MLYIIIIFVPHLEFASLLMQLFRVEPPSSLFSLCLLVTKCPVPRYVVVVYPLP